MDSHGYQFGFWISMDKWLSISDACKYLFLNQILSDKMHISWKLLYFWIDSWINLSEIEIVSRNIQSFLKITNWFVLKIFNSFMDYYYDFKRKTNRKSLWMHLRNPWTKFSESWSTFINPLQFLILVTHLSNKLIISFFIYNYSSKLVFSYKLAILCVLCKNHLKNAIFLESWYVFVLKKWNSGIVVLLLLFNFTSK
jgi:hypothetical protein